MKRPSSLPAHGKLVREVVSAGGIPAKLQSFPAIARNFPPQLLHSYAERPPYYCHYMEWLIARSTTESLSRFEQLLRIGEGINHWKDESRSLRRSPDFSEFWSLNWQLQVAEYFTTRGYSLVWQATGGPDLRAELEGDIRFIECTTPRKHFGVGLFLEQLLRVVSPRLRIEHQMFMKRSMPRGQDLDSFLGELFERLLEPGYVDLLAEQAAQAYPIVIKLPEGASNLTVYYEGEDPDVYDPYVLPAGHGDMDAYFELILQEVVSNKHGANQLSDHRPNAVVVNFLLGDDQQVANMFAEPAMPELSPDIDELIWATVGVRREIEPGDLRSTKGWLP